jgi:hypothetical protein
MTIAETILPVNQAGDVRSTPDKKLLRAGLLMLLFMTTAFGAATWNTVRDLSIQIKAVPVLLFGVVCILVARLYAKADEIAAVRPMAASAVEPIFGPNLTVHERTVELSHFAQVPLEVCDPIWSYWDKNGTGRKKIEYVSRIYGMQGNVVQHLLERYDARWREQVAMLYWDNPLNEYTAYVCHDKNQVAEDAVRLKSGLPIYPVAGVWLCSDCRQRPCHCDRVTSNDLDRA